MFQLSKTRDTLDKNNVYQATNSGYDIFKKYIPDFQDEGKAFKALFRKDDKPSANVFKAEDGTYLYKDFADDKALNPIEFIMKLKSCKFFEALKFINIDMKLNLIVKETEGTVQIGDDISYWNEYETHTASSSLASMLAKYNVNPIKSYITNKGFRVVCTKGNPAFAFKLDSNYTKIYKPLEPNPKYKHLYLGTKPQNYQQIFGLQQLPTHCNTILIVEGLKDCIVSNLNLNQVDIYSVGLDNASSRIKPEILKILREKCNNLILCLDIDEVGLKMSGIRSKEYGIRNFILPKQLKENKGKDISDWFKFKLSTELLLNELNKILESPEPIPIQNKDIEPHNKSLIKKLMDIEQLILERSSKPIIFSEPLIRMGDVPIIRKGTINIVQGKYGSHKSRIGELFCSLLVSVSDNCNTSFLQFEKSNEAITVIYIDTERNLKEEFPNAIQSVINNSCNQSANNFRFTSIKGVDRAKRLDAVKTFLEDVKNNTTNALFVLLDVVTDCVADFNSASESMKLFDYLGNLCDNYDATFLLIIHQNPNSEKARGHTGTEAANKASTVMQIGYERCKNNEDSDIIALKFFKIRSAKRPASIYLKFDETQKKLVLAEPEAIASILNERRQIAAIDDVVEKLGKLLKPSLNQKDLLKELGEAFNCTENTLKNRLVEIANNKMEIINERERPCELHIKTANGKPTVYELKELDYHIDDEDYKEI